jgi:hypothetical protein
MHIQPSEWKESLGINDGKQIECKKKRGVKRNFPSSFVSLFLQAETTPKCANVLQDDLLSEFDHPTE